MTHYKEQGHLPSTAPAPRIAISRNEEPAPAPAEPPAALPEQRTEQRELQNHDEQTALPTGTTTEPEPLGDTPQHAVQPTLTGSVLPAPAPSIETSAERQERREAESAQARQDNYQKAVEVVMEFVRQQRPFNGAQLAEDDRVPVGTRSAQRYLKKMVEEGIVPQDLILK
ncbi:hypothetical protein [Streptomyces sp. Ac-502]|uniref:hypothetical protein n=1 Tax=Streptomyces sp. Ac-502 TaxID=3342801 RepID=UPI00386283FA